MASRSGVLERFREIYGLRNRLRATRVEARGVWVGWKTGPRWGGRSRFAGDPEHRSLRGTEIPLRGPHAML